MAACAVIRYHEYCGKHQFIHRKHTVGVDFGRRVFIMSRNARAYVRADVKFACVRALSWAFTFWTGLVGEKKAKLLSEKPEALVKSFLFSSLRFYAEHTRLFLHNAVPRVISSREISRFLCRLRANGAQRRAHWLRADKRNNRHTTETIKLKATKKLASSYNIPLCGQAKEETMISMSRWIGN